MNSKAEFLADKFSEFEWQDMLKEVGGMQIWTRLKIVNVRG